MTEPFDKTSDTPKHTPDSSARLWEAAYASKPLNPQKTQAEENITDWSMSRTIGLNFADRLPSTAIFGTCTIACSSARSAITVLESRNVIWGMGAGRLNAFRGEELKLLPETLKGSGLAAGAIGINMLADATIFRHVPYQWGSLIGDASTPLLAYAIRNPWLRAGSIVAAHTAGRLADYTLNIAKNR